MIGKLKNVRSIQFTDLNITELPDTMKDLTRLRTIDLRQDRFSQFPEILTQIPSLEEIDISNSNAYNPGNTIKSIPSSIKNNIRLKKLNTSYNALE